MNDEQQIRTLVESWAAAAHTGDLTGVLADHSDDIVMFDVPPPDQGARGLEAYRETWPGFLEWQAQGATYDIVELDVTAGTEVAFAWALMRCGTAEHHAARPDRRLRVTFGLRRQDARWVVAHEHHSFPDDGTDDSAAAEQIRAVHDRWIEQTAAADLDGLMEPIADDVVSYEHATQLEYDGKDALREVCRQGIDDGGGARIDWETPGLSVLVRDDLAVTWGLDHLSGAGFDSWSRGTRVFRRTDGTWRLVHQHLSYPLDRETGAALTGLRR